jgi:hypothetical protein
VSVSGWADGPPSTNERRTIPSGYTVMSPLSAWEPTAHAVIIAARPDIRAGGAALNAGPNAPARRIGLPARGRLAILVRMITAEREGVRALGR